MEIFKTWYKALSEPEKFFKKEKKKADFWAGARHILLAGLITGLFMAIIGLFATTVLNTMLMITTGSAASVGALIFVAVLIAMPITSFLIWVIVGAVYYIFAKLLGGKGNYYTQLYLMALYMAPLFILSTVLGMVPGMLYANFAVGDLFSTIITVYSLFPLTMALKITHKFDTTKALLSWMIPWIVLIVLSLITKSALTSVLGL